MIHIKWILAIVVTLIFIGYHLYHVIQGKKESGIGAGIGAVFMMCVGIMVYMTLWIVWLIIW